MRKRVLVLLALMMLLSCVPVFAASTGAMTDENTYIDESGNIYTYQNDKVYQLIDGKLYEVVTGQEQSIIDVMKQKPGSEVPDAEIMGQTQSIIGSTIGVALNVIIYVFFAMTAFTTACDLLYIGVPAIRPTLYDGAGGVANANIHTSAMHGLAAHQQQRANNAAMMGDMSTANRMQNAAMQSEAVGQYRDQHWFGNDRAIERAQERAAGAFGGRCFISRELKSLVSAGQVNVTMTSGTYNMYGGTGPAHVGTTNSNILLSYVKRRAVSIVIIIAVFMLLVTSTVFTDFGLNIGKMIYQKAASFLGF